MAEERFARTRPGREPGGLHAETRASFRGLTEEQAIERLEEAF